MARIYRQVLQPLRKLNYGNSMNRLLSTHTINDSLYLCTDKPRIIEVDKKSLKFNQVKENSKPIVLMISWLNGRKSHVIKYAQLYTDQGFDVLVGRITIFQAMFQLNSHVRFSQNIIDIFHENEDHYPEIVIHSFSIGALAWGLALKLMKRNEKKYGNIPKRVVGQVWDSMTHASNIMVGYPFAVAPNSKLLQWLIKNFVAIYLKYYRAMTVHFKEGIESFQESSVRSPILIFVSKSDKIATLDFATGMADTWKDKGVDVTLKVYEDTPHVKHFMKYPDDYRQTLYEHWKRMKLLETE